MSIDDVLLEKSLNLIQFIFKMCGIKMDKAYINNIKTVRFRGSWFLYFLLIWYNSDVAAEVAWTIDSAIKGKSLVELTYPVPGFTMCFLADAKILCVVANLNHVNDILNTLLKLQAKSIVTKEIKMEITDQFKSLRKVTMNVFWAYFSAVLIFGIVPHLTMATKYYATGELELVFSYPVLYPIDLKGNKVLWLLEYLRQNYSSSLIALATFGPDSLYYACCTYIQIQFRILQFEFEQIVPKNSILNKYELVHKDALWKKFLVLVGQHQELIRCVSILERIFSKSTLFNALSSSVLICLTGFNVTAFNNWIEVLPFIAFLLLAFSQIYIFCLYGDNIMRFSTDVGNAIYNCRWYVTDAETMNDLRMVLHRSQKACKLTAYGFADVNLRTFTKILSTSWSYFALLTTINRKHT